MRPVIDASLILTSLSLAILSSPEAYATVRSLWTARNLRRALLVLSLLILLVPVAVWA